MPLPDITILHHTPHFVIINKPTGMLSVPGKGPDKQDCAAARVRAAFPQATGPLVVHRLDMETSGLLVFALDEETQRRLSAQFENRQVEKAYHALVAGPVRDDTGEVRAPIRADISNRPHQVIDFAQGRPSVTRFHVLSREVDRTRLRLEPVTGRTHQLRVHAAWPGPAPEGADGGTLIASPILGDALYGDPTSAPRLMLHATELSLLDPQSGRRAHFVSPTPF